MKKEKKSTESSAGNKRIVLVRVRGDVHLRSNIRDTMKLLRLNKVNHCSLVANTPVQGGMIKKAKDYITYGEIDGGTLSDMLRKKGRLIGDKRLSEDYIKENTNFSSIDEFAEKFMSFEAELSDIPDLKPVFRLKPPSKGYDRGGIKQPYTKGGALGYRSEKINDLLKRMI